MLAEIQLWPNSVESDLLIGILLYTLLESGFILSNLNDDFNSIATYWGYEFVAQIPKNYTTAMTSTFAQHKINQNAKDLTISLKLLNFTEETVSLLIRRVFDGDAMCISLCFGLNSTSICLPVNKFIKMKSTNEGCPKQICMDYLLKNVAELVTEIKVNLIRPIRNRICLSSGYGCPNINGLPNETLQNILKYLNLKTLQCLSQTSVYLRDHIIIYLNENHRFVSTRRSTPIMRHQPMQLRFAPFPNHYRFNDYIYWRNRQPFDRYLQP